MHVWKLPATVNCRIPLSLRCTLICSGGLEKFPQKGDIKYMNDFAKGMNSIGQLFPDPVPYEDYPRPDSAWEGVAKSFQQAGNDLWAAIEEYEHPNVLRERAERIYG